MDDVSLRIEQGEYVSIIGPAGGFIEQTQEIQQRRFTGARGTYCLNDRDVTSLSDMEQAQVRSREIGFVFQMFHLVPRLTAEENVALPLLLAGVGKEERQALV
ncbi:MAG: ATP-binding cassette domain-containing protein, partial [Pseudomonadota bacterium]